MTARAGRPDVGAGRPLARWLVVAALVVGLLASLTLHGLLERASAGRSIGAPVLADAAGLGPALGVGPASLRSAPAASGGVGVALVDGGSTQAWRGRGGAGTPRCPGHLVRHRAHRARSPRRGAPRPGGRERGRCHRLLGTGPGGAALLARPDRAVEHPGRAGQQVGRHQPAAAGAVERHPRAGRRRRGRHRRARGANGYLLVAGAEPERAGPGDVAVVPLDRGGPARLDALLARLAAEGIPRCGCPRPRASTPPPPTPGPRPRHAPTPRSSPPPSDRPTPSPPPSTRSSSR